MSNLIECATSTPSHDAEFMMADIIKGRDPDANDTLPSSEEEPDDELDLPQPELSNINNIRECFATHYRMMRREKLSAALKNQGYIPRLLELFRMCEDLDNKEALKTLYEIFKSIWMLNQGEIYEILFKNEHIFVSVNLNFKFDHYFCVGRGWRYGI